MEFVFSAESSGESGFLKDGTYQVYCESCELKETKDQTGDYLQCDFKVIEGSRKGYRITQRFTNRNRSEDAVRIGHQQLSNYCRAIGVTKVTDTNQLCGKALLVEVESRKRRDDPTKMEVVIKKYLEIPEGVKNNLPAYLAEEAKRAEAANEETPF